MKINLDNNLLEVVITRKKIEKTYLRIRNDKLMVSTNLRATDKYINNMINENMDKIKKLYYHSVNELKENECLLWGNKLILKKTVSPTNVLLDANSLEICTLNDDHDLILDFFYKQAALGEIEIVKNECLKKFNNLNPIFEVKKYKSRYGVCFPNKNKIILNSYLAKYPNYVLKSIIYHELCHFLCKGHQKDFYEILRSVDENFIKTKVFLKNNHL